MTIQPVVFNLTEALTQWGVVFVSFLAAIIVVSMVTSLAMFGVSGPVRVCHASLRHLTTFCTPSPRRVLAIASLTFKESIRRKALLVFVVFALIFMFGSWFVQDPGERPDLQVKNYVAFVFFAITWLVLPVILLLCCWGLPEDIRLRSLHTVVTKPVQRNEVVLGRMLGFVQIGTLILGLMSVAGYIWINRVVTDNVELICRVPVYAETISFLDRQGQPGEGVNVGDKDQTRAFIEGGTKAAAIFQFPVEVSAGELRFESRFEAFRTWKGDMNRTLRVRLQLHNPDTQLVALLPTYEVNEFTANLVGVPGVVKWTDPQTLASHEADLFNELCHVDKESGKRMLEVQVQCMDRGQYLGLSEGDFFMRLPDRSFAVGYFTAVAGVWMKMVVVIMVGVTASCFLKWPVATLLTSTVIVIGVVARGLLDALINNFIDPQGRETIGPLEAVYRLLMHMNDTTPLPDNMLSVAMERIDLLMVNFVNVVRYIIPDMTSFSMSDWLANGFAVPFDVWAPSLAMTAGYFIPCLLLGYLSLTLRELESK